MCLVVTKQIFLFNSLDIGLNVMWPVTSNESDTPDFGDD